MLREEYSRTASLDLRLAMAAALAAHLRSLRFDVPGRTFGFSKVYDEWPSWLSGNASPAACVLPDEELVYANARMTPSLLEDTWEPVGQAGWGLYALNDAECDMGVTVRASSSGERSALVRGIEESLVEDGVTGNYEVGRRLGRMLTIDAYYGVPGRFKLVSSRVLDDGETAAKNLNEATFIIRAQTVQVKVDRVVPFQLRILDETV